MGIMGPYKNKSNDPIETNRLQTILSDMTAKNPCLFPASRDKKPT